MNAREHTHQLVAVEPFPIESGLEVHELVIVAFVRTEKEFTRMFLITA